MARCMRSSRLAILVGLAIALAVLLVGVYTQGPSEIPYESWTVPQGEKFPLSTTDPELTKVNWGDEDLANADDFVFSMGDGSGMFGLDVFRVDAKGAATYVFATGNRGNRNWWKIEFSISKEELTSLRRSLIELDYRSMARGYHAHVADGTQWCMRVDVAGETKKVYCNNYFPIIAQKLAALIGREILPAHEAEIKRARRIWETTAWSESANLW